uniref:Coiled-coil domain containing 12 n=1 Tax=Equus caballus TaxID=9796 RepID=A0A9L0R6C8_HORSE
MGQMRATWAARDSLDRDGSLTDSAGPLLPSPLSPSPQPAWEDFLLSHPRPWIGHERVIYSSGLRDAGRETRRAGKMAATPAGVGRLEEEALRRKERLKALREKTGRKNTSFPWSIGGPSSLQELCSQPPHVYLLSTSCVPGPGDAAVKETASLPQGTSMGRDKEDGEPKTKQLREGEEEGEKHRELRLRNYVPEDEDLKRRRVPPAKPVAVEEKVKEQLEAAKPEPVIEEVDLANLAPRKPDWDLKRDVAKKLEKLEKRTQRAIAELIRERLKGQEDSLASAVDANTEQEACDSD